MIACLPACLPASRFKYYYGDPLGTVKVLYMHAEPQRLNPAGRFDRFNKSNRNSTAFVRVPVPAAISVAGMAIVGGGGHHLHHRCPYLKVLLVFDMQSFYVSV